MEQTFPQKIFMASSNSWNSSLQVGTHHLAREFLNQGSEVAFISDPISPFHFLKGSEVNKRWELYRRGGLIEKNFWAYVPLTLLPPQNRFLLRSKWIHHQWQNLTFPSLFQKVKEHGFEKVDLLYLDSPVQTFWLDWIQAKKTVYRMADRQSGFKKTSPALLDLEDDLIRRVDLVACTAQTLVETALKRAQKVVHFPNGIHFSTFSKPHPEPEEYKHIQKPIAVYVGALEYWLDWALLKKLAQELPDVSFVLIGKQKEKWLEPFQNVHFLGSKPHSDLPGYLQFADAGLIPFDAKNFPELVHCINPLKLYEYWASGLGIVSTYFQELSYIQSPALLSFSHEEFKENLLQLLQRKDKVQDRFPYESLDWSVKAKELIHHLFS